MPKVKIDIYEDGAPAATISIPGWVVTGGASLLPKGAGKPLRDHVDLRELVELLKNPQANGKLIEVEDHAAGDRIVISVVKEDEQ